MDEITDGEKRRHPRQIDDRYRTRAEEKATDLIEVAHRLVRFARISA